MPARSGRDTVHARVLYIEDNRENRMLVRAILEAEGYTIVDAEDGLSGIEAAIREQPDLILLDINLPGVDGYEVVSILKSFPNIATTPVIALTAYAMEGDRQRTLVAGCDGYIQKPIDVDAFPRQVAEFMRGKREHVEEREQGIYLRELNQRLVYRLVNQVEELKRLNQHFVRRATQLAELHRAVQDITSEVGVADLLEKLLPHLARALNTTLLNVELSEPAGVRVSVTGDGGERPRSVLSGAVEAVEDWVEVEWSLPLSVRGRQVGTMTARHVLPPGAKADEEQLLNIVANQVAIAVENSRLYDRVTHRAVEQESLVAAGRLLTETLQMSEVQGRLAQLIQNRLGGVVRIWLRDATSGELSLSAQAGGTIQAGDDDMAPARALAPVILEQRTPVIIPDLGGDARITRRDWIAGEGFVSFLGVPLLLAHEAVGILSVLSREPRTFTPDEVAFAEALASSAAAAIRNARSYEQTEGQLRTTETFLAVSQAVGSTLELTEVLRRTARAMARAVGADIAGAWLMSKEGDRFIPLVGYHVPKDLVQSFGQTPITSDHPLFQQAKSLETAIHSADSQADARFDHPLSRLIPHKSLLIQPMWLKGENIGGFALAWIRGAHATTPDELRLIDGIARLAAVAVENARLLDAERQAQARQKVFVEIVEELSAEDDFERLFSLIGRRACELLGADTATVSLIDGDQIEFRDWYGLPQPEGIILRRPVSESRFRRGIAARHAFVCPDMQTDPEWKESNFTRLGYRAVIDTPIVLRDKVIGVLAVFYTRPRPFSDEDVALLVSLSGHTAVALDRTNLVRELKGRLEESQTLLAVSRAVSATLDLSEMLRRVSRSMAGALGADMVGAYLADADMQYLRPIAGYHVPPHLRDDVPIRLRGHRLIEEAWESQQAVMSATAGDDPRLDPDAYARFKHRSIVFIPMITRGEVIGGLFAIWWSRAATLGREDLRLVEGIARQAAIAIENSRLYEGVKRQMSELKQTQAQLIQSTKLAAIGELAANIAHEINNPLTTVLGFASFLAEKLEPGAPTLEELNLIQEEATRARDIVRDLLQFSRQSDFLPAMSDINVVVEQVVAMVRRQGAVDMVEVHEVYGDDLPLVEMDVSRIKQVFLNLINNALYAMPDGGSLTIRTSAQGGYLLTQFTDTGTGIDGENLPRIFDPFFTTKPDVSGTGLGLSVSLGIIQSHSGTIEAESAVGKGSTFTVKLPFDAKPTRES